MFLKKQHKWSLTACAVVTALALTAAGCGEQAVTQQAQALPVDVFTVTTADVPVVSRLTGRATPTRRAEVRPQVSGVIQARLFTEGSNVQAGEQLYQIDPAVYQAQYDSAKANLSSAQASLHTAQLRAERYRKLLATNAVSKQDYDDAQATYLQAVANVEAAGAAVQTADINLAYTKVYAPISGRISRSNVTEGALVSAQQAEPMTTIQQLDPMYVDLGQTVEAHLQLREAIASGQFKITEGKAPVDIYFSKSTVFAQDVRVLNVVDITESKQKFVMLEIQDKDVASFVSAASSDTPVIIQRNKNEKSGYKFGATLAKLPQMPVETASSVPQNLVEISDIPPDEPIKAVMPSKNEKPKTDDEVPVVQADDKDEQEIEFISGDKKIIVGAPR